jgi:ketosteroid isomerase-like protein
MKKSLLAVVALSTLSSLLPLGAVSQSPSQESAAVQARIDAEDLAIAKAIRSRDFAVFDKYWSPLLVVNSPANEIVNRDQVIQSMFHGGLNYTSLKGTTEFFTVSNGVAIKMMHEDVVMADGPMAGKHVVRRSTNILERSGDDWVLLARQATYVGFDGAILRGPVTTIYSAPPATPETTAIRAQIEANNRAVGHAIGTMDFAALGKLWSPGMVVNSPGNNVLTREQVFAAMREDKLNYTSAKAVPEAFIVSKDLAIEMGHDDIVMANGPMAGKPLTRRFTNVWQKTGDSWVQIARQATYVGIDGGAVYGQPDPNLKP